MLSTVILAGVNTTIKKKKVIKPLQAFLPPCDRYRVHKTIKVLKLEKNSMNLSFKKNQNKLKLANSEANILQLSTQHGET